MQDKNSIPNQTFTEETPLVSPYANYDGDVQKAESLLRQVGDTTPEAVIYNPGKSNNFLFGKSVGQIFAISAILLSLIIGVAVVGVLRSTSGNSGKKGDGQALLASAGASKQKDEQQRIINNSILQINRSTVINKSFEASGDVLIQSAQDSDNAFKIQSSSGNNILIADTEGKKITVGDQPPGNVSLAVNGDITVNGQLVSTSEGYALNNQGLTIGGVLVCTANGCVSSNSPPPTPASPSIDVANLMYLNTNQTIAGAKTFNSATAFNANVTVNAPLQVAGNVNTTSGFSVNGISGGNFSCAANELLQQAVIHGGIITSGTCVTVAGSTTPTLQDVYDASTPANVILSNASGVFDIQDAASPLATNLFQVGSNGNATLYFAVNNLGISVTGNINTTGQYRVGGVQISSANLSNDSNLAKLNGNQSFSGNNTFSSAGNSFTGNGSGLTSLNASNISSGTLSDARLSNNVALLNALQTFTGANTFSNASNSFTGNGSGLTSLNATNVSSGTLNDARLSPNVTLAGNTFNGANQLVQLTAGGILPVLNGSNLTSLNASNISSGTLADARLSSNVALLNANNIFLGNNSFHLNSTALTVQDAASPLGVDLFTVTDNTGATKYFEVSATGAKINGDDVCTTAGNCVGTGSGGAIGGGGTAGTIAKFTGSGFTVGDSLLSEAGSVVAVNGSINIASGNTYQINGSQISSANLSNDSNLAKLNGTQTFSGANTFSNAANSFTGNGSGLTSLNASNVSSGTLNDARLSANVALKNGNNTFTGDNVFSLLNNPLSVQDASTPLGTNLFEITDNSGLTKYFTVSATALQFNGNDVCTTAGNCSGVGGSITGSGTSGKLAKFTGSGTIGDSLISDNGSTVTVGGVLAVNTITPTATLTIGTPTQTLTLQGDASTSLSAKSGSFTNTLVFAAPALANHTITLPNASGTVAVSASGPLSLDAAGNLTCPDCLTTTGSGGGSGVSSVNTLSGDITLAGTANQVIITPSGSTLTFSLPQDIGTSSTPDFAGIDIGGSAISSSNLSDGANLAKLNGTQTFTGANTFSNASNSFTGDGSGLTNLNASNVSSGTLNDARLSGNVALLNRTGQIFTGDNTIKVNSANAFQVQNAGGGNILSIDTNNSSITLNGANNGSTTAWATNTNSLPAGRNGVTSVTANGFVYALGGSNAGAQTSVYYAKINSDGSIASWTTSSNPLPSARYFSTAVVANGYLYVIGGYNASNVPQSTVYYAKLNADGSTGAWTTSSQPLTSARAEHTSVISNGFLYVIGGYDTGLSYQSTVYYARLNADGSTGTWTTSGNNLNGAQASHTSVVANGYVYVLGGYRTLSPTVQFAKLNTDGSTGTWSAGSNAIPSVLGGLRSVVANGYAYVLGGYDGASEPTVYYAKLNNDGTTGTWTASSNNMPAGIDSFGAVVINGYIYAIGGQNTSSVAQTGVYYTSTSRIQIAGSIDLVGLAGGTLTDGGTQSFGSTGGSITAGNITAVGTLNVQGQGSFNGGVSVKGDLTVNNNGYFGGELAVGNSASVNAAQLLYPGWNASTAIDIEQTDTSLGGNQKSGIINYLVLNPSGAPTASTYLSDNEVETKAGNSQNFGVINAVYGQAMHFGSGSVTTLSGTDGYVYNESTGSVQNAIGGNFGAFDDGGGGSIQNAYGVQIQSSTGNVVNNYGLYVQDQSGAGSTLSYNIYSAGTNSKNLFAGSLEVDGNTLVKKTSSTAFQVQNASGNNILSVDTSGNNVGLGKASTITGNLQFFNSGGSGSISLAAANPAAASYTITIPAENGTICTTAASAACTSVYGGGSGTTSNLSQIYANGASAANQTLVLSSANGGGVIFQDASTTVGNLLTIQNNAQNVNYFNVTNTGISATNVAVQAGGVITIAGGNTGSRPGSPTAGTLYFDTTTNQLIQYNGTKWVSDRSTATKIVAASNSTQAEKDAADYVAAGSNDQNTINTAISALPGGGGFVYLMDGTYSVSGSINLPNNVTLSGAGASTILTIPNAQNGTYNVITNSDTSTGTHILIQNLLIDGNRSNQSSGSVTGIFMDHVGGGTGSTARDGARISNVILKNLNGLGLQFGTGTSNGSVSDSTAINDSAGFVIGTGTGGTLNNTITNNLGQGNTTYGFWALNADGSTFAGNTAEGNGTNGFYVTTNYATFTGNTSINNSQAGFSLSAHSYNTITGNTAKNNTTGGILLLSSNNNAISGNKVHDNGGSTANIGISLQSSNQNNVNGNDITDTSCSSNCHAISLDASSSGNYISANHILGDGTHKADISDSGTGNIYANQEKTENGDALFRDGTDSTSAFQVQNSSGTNLLNVDTLNSTISLLGNNSGEVSAWITNANALTAPRQFATSVTANGYVYVLGGNNGGAQSTVYYAKLNADGSVGTWNTAANALPAVRAGHSSVSANGYVYVLGGFNGGGTAQSTVYYAKLNADGSVGTWNTAANALPAVRNAHTSVTANGYVYVLGGSTDGTAANSQSTVYYAKLNADGSVGTWNTAANALPNAREYHASVVANGYVYVVGGFSAAGSRQSTVYYAKLNADGSVGTWNTAANALPALRSGLTSVVANGYIYAVGGFSGGTSTDANAYYAKLNADGSVGTWNTAANAMPAGRQGVATAVVNGYIYEISGNDGTTNQSTVYYASTSRVQIGGSLDLVGLQGQTLADGGGLGQGSTGGSITAGNGNFVGSLQVQGQANFNSGLAVNGVADIAADSTSALQVQNAAGSEILFNIDSTARSASGGNLIKIGNSSGTDTATTVLVVDSNAGTLTSNLSALNGGIYYNSSTNHLNIIENGAAKEVCNKTDLGCGSSSTSQTKVVAMGSPAGCTGSVPVASLDTNADYVVNSCTSAQTTINTAITALGSTGGTVYLKEGTYIIDGTINMASNVTLAGAGAGTTLKLKDSINAGIDLITLSSINRVTVKDLRLDGNRTNNTSGTQNAFNISSVGSGTGTSAVPGLSATDITVQNFRSDAFSISSITNSVISNSNLINNGSRGIEFKFSGGTNDSYLRINGNTIQGSGDRGIWGDITGNPSYVTIDDNIIESNTGAGVYLSGNSNTVSGNVFRSNGNKGIQLFGSNNTVSSNNFVSNTGSGVYVRGGGNAISGNTMTSNTGNGVEIDSASSGQNAVTGNKINSNGSSGIYAGGSNNSITGNDVMSNTGHGIEVVSSSNNVTGNAVASNTSDGIHIGCCSNVNNIVSGNQVSSNSGSGITVDASDTTKIDGNWIYNNGGSGSTSSILVFANAFHTPDKNIITNNTIVDTAGTGYAIELSGGLKPTNTYISGNSYSGTGATSFLTTGTTGTTYINQAQTATSDYLYRFGSDSATAFQVQNAGGSESLLSIDTTARSASGGNLIKIGNSTGSDTATTILVLDSAASAPTSNLGALNGGLFYSSGTGHINVVEGGVVKELCNKTDLGCGTGSTPTLAQVYSYGASTSDSTIALDSTRGGIVIKDNSTPISGTLFSVQNNSGGKFLDVTSSTITLGENTVANATSTATTATTSGTGTNTTTVTLTAVNSLANGDVIFIDNAGQDYFTRITAGGGTTSLTVDPAVTFENARTVIKYNAQYLGSDGTNFTGATRNQNSFYQGYFLGGVVTGAGSTVYSDANISSVGNLQVNTAAGVNIKGTNTTNAFQVQNASGVGLFNVDSTNMKISFAQSGFSLTDLSAPSSPGVAAGATTGGTLSGAAATTYYYKITAMSGTGESLGSTEVSINGQGFTKLSAPTAPTVGAPSAGGSVTIGTHSYKVTFVTANGETTGGTTSSQVNVTTGGTQTVALTAIPTGPTGTTQRKIYRTVAGDTGNYLLLTTLANNTTTTFNDTIADASLGAAAPASNTATTNTNTATVSWTAVSGATGYRIYRGTTAGAESAYQTAANSPFTDTGAAGTAGTVHTYSTIDAVGIGTSSPAASLDVEGTALFKNAANTTGAFQIQDASGTSVLNADTTNRLIGINNTAATATLDVVASAQSYFEGFESGTTGSFSGALWAATTVNSHTGSYSIGATSGGVGTLTVTKSMATAGTVSFWANIQSGCCATPSTFRVDGVTQQSWSPNTTTPWTFYSFAVSSGSHTYTWAFNNTQPAYWYIDDFKLTMNTGSSYAAAFNGGNVGIGTSTPGSTLEVNGTTTFKLPTTANAFQIQNGIGSQILTADPTNNSITISQGNLAVKGLSTPQVPTLTSSGTGGTLAAGTYYYQVAATNVNGVTPAIASNPSSVTTSGSTSQNTLTWTAVTNASGYNIYRSTNGTTWFVNSVGSGVTSLVDNGSTYTWSSGISPPTTNTTGGNLTVQGTATYANLTNSNSAFDVQDATGDSILKVDSTNRFVGINSATSPVATLDVTAMPPAPDFSFGFEDGTYGSFAHTGSQALSPSFAHSGNYGWGGNSSSSGTMTLTRTLASAGTISFWAATYSFWGGNCNFSIDAVCKLVDNSGFTSYSYYSYAVSAGTHTFFWNASPDTAGYMYLDDVTVGVNASNPTAAVFHGGNVGIGTTAPGATLEVDGNSIFKAAPNVTSTLQIQNASGDSLFNADTTNTQITIGRFVDSSLSAPASPGAAAGSNQGGTLSGAAGSTYYYKVSAMTVDGETPLSSEVSINGASFTALTAPTAATVGAPSAGGSVTLGTHSYKVTFVTANGETTGGTASSQVNVTTGGTQTVPLTGIPTGPTGTTQRKIYRTVAGDTGNYLLVTTLANNTTTTYNDTTADGSLGAAAPASNTATTNTNNATISWTAVTGATGYRVYRSTTSGAQTSYQTAASSPFTDTGAAGTSLSNTSLAVKGTVAVQNVANSTTAFQIQNAAGSSLFNIDSVNNAITILGNNSGQLGTWQTNVNNISGKGVLPPATAVANGYIYVFGGFASSAYTNTVQYAKLNSDGSTGVFNTTTSLPANTCDQTIVTANGFVYSIGGCTTGGGAVASVYYARMNGDGTLGSWVTSSNPLPAVRKYSAGVYFNGYIYEFGGYNDSTAQSTVYYTKVNADGSIGAWQTAANALPAAVNQHTAVTANGYAYVIGGGTTVYYAKFNADGSVGTWTTSSNPLPVSRTFFSSVVSNGYVYAIGGGDTATYFAKLNSDGSTSGWTLNTTALPAARAYHSSAVYNGYVYVIGGNNSNPVNNTVYYASTARLQVGANLDLIGPQGQNLADSGDISAGSTGGSITAGNITAVGSLQVQGAANFSQSMAVNGNLSVAGQSIALGSANNGELSNWTTNSNSLPAAREYASSVVANGYVYEIGGNTGSSSVTTVYYAKLNADGTTGSWTTSANALPAATYAHSSVVANGYIYIIGGDNASVTSSVYYAKLNSDGSTGAWQTNANSLPANRARHSSFVANGYVYVLGGNDGTNTFATVYYAKLNPNGSTGAWQTNANALPTTLRYGAAVAANGYAYYVGGFDNTNVVQSNVYYGKLNSDGSIGTWNTSSNPLPAARSFPTSVVANGYIYALAGQNTGGTDQSNIYYAKLKSDGSTSSWITNGASLPSTRSGHSSVIANGYVYTIGGISGGTVQSSVYFASTSRVTIGASLDLVGLQGQTLADPGDGYTGSSGGSITAGNITAVGTLQVQGAVNFAQSLNVSGNFSVDSILFADTTNLTITLGQPSATPVLLVLGNKNTTGDPTCTDGAIYYNSNSSQFRACQAGIWTTFGNGFFTSNTNQPTVSNTAAETAFSPTPAPGQSYTLPANYCVPGRIIHISASGTAVSGAADSYDARIRLDNTAGQLLGDDSGYPTSASSRAWSLELTITCMTTGTSGTANVQGRYYAPTGDLYGNTNLITGNVSGNITLNTTVSHAIVVTGDWNTANAANIGTMNQFIVTSEGP